MSYTYEFFQKMSGKVFKIHERMAIPAYIGNFVGVRDNILSWLAGTAVL